MHDRVLVLGGTQEARRLAAKLQQMPHVQLTYALAGRTSAPNTKGIDTNNVHRGGFGGTQGLATFLRTHNISALIDATHPYATQISDHALRASESVHVAFIQLVRPTWQAEAQDRWTHVSSLAAAATTLQSWVPAGASLNVLLTCGNRGLDSFAKLQRIKLWTRLIEAPLHPLPSNVEKLYARGPFDVERERDTFRTLQVDIIVTKNSGGDATQAKLQAARELGLRVVMIERPVTTHAAFVESVDAALDWLTQYRSGDNTQRREPADPSLPTAAPPHEADWSHPDGANRK